MAIRVQTQGDINFGVMAAAQRVTHIRIQQNDDANPAVKELAAPVDVAAGRELIIPSGEFDLVYPAGETNNNHISAMVTPYFNGVTFKLDALTDATTVVNDTGYSQQTYSNWSITQEAD